MKLSPKRIQALRVLLKNEFDLDYSDEELQVIGITIVRFVIAKYKKSQED